MSSFFLNQWQGIEAQSGTWYKNIKHLGTGGNSVVFLVYSTGGENEGVPFALKVFRNIIKEDRRMSFFDEIAFLEESSHPSVMKVYDKGIYGQSEPTYPFVVSEYYPKTLRIQMNHGDSIHKKTLYAMQLVSALSYISGKGYIHRDIKPENIFIKGNSCILGDYGLIKNISHLTDDDRDILKESIGPGMPFCYRTPDLVNYARNEEVVTCMTDIFQLGLVLAELFTGENPLCPCQNHLDDIELSPIGRIDSNNGGLIGSTLNKMLQMNPTDRPSHAELANTFELIFQKTCEEPSIADL